MAERLYGSCPEACFFSVGARSFEYGEKLSPEVESALPGLIEEVCAAGCREPYITLNEENTE
jgi:hypothetical protein